MAVHRVGPTAEPPRQDLGRVRVGIDDLQALLDLLRARNPGGDPIRVEFTGGYFDEAQDLKQLNDNELTTIKIKAANVEVTLDSVEATAIGPEDVIGDVYRSWARTRQLPRVRWTHRTSQRLNWVLLSAIGILFTSAIVALNLGGSDPGLLPLNLLGACLVLALTGMLAGFFEPTKRPAAVIEPFTLDEKRAARVSNRWPKAAVIVSIVSAAIAVLAIVVPIVVSR